MTINPLLKLITLFSAKKDQVALPTPSMDAGKPLPSVDVFSTGANLRMSVDEMNARAFLVTPKNMIVTDTDGKQFAMDDGNNQFNIKSLYSINGQRVPDGILGWYVNQSFMGFQNCAVMAQNWLIDKACRMPAEDAARNGWEIAINDGDELSPELLLKIKEADVKYKAMAKAVELTAFKRVFGFRIARMVIESDDPDYYLKPYNPDGIKKGSFKGIAQVDPTWITPELDAESVNDPFGLDFYEPTYWRVGGRRYHKSHLIVVRHSEVADVLKPSYIYGGVSLTQQIYERVYAAERTANEAPQLAMTKRMNVVKADLSKVFQNPTRFVQRMEEQAAYRDNFGTRVIDTDEDYTQHETSLADLDSVIMSQYQLVAAISEVPATKLLGTPPKGFNATGENETQSYHEMLAGLQAHDMTPLLERYYEVMLRSDFGIKAKVEVIWNPMDEPTEEQQAAINKTKADMYSVLQTTGAIDGQDIRDALIKDRSSGFNGIDAEMPEGPTDYELTDETPDAEA
mgnify:CR=1 FL=1